MRTLELLVFLGLLATPLAASAQCVNDEGTPVEEGDNDPLNTCALCRSGSFYYLPERTACDDERRIFCDGRIYRLECVPVAGTVPLQTTCEENERFAQCPNGLRCEAEYCLTRCESGADCRPQWTCSQSGACEPPDMPDMGTPDMGVDAGPVDMGADVGADVGTDQGNFEDQSFDGTGDSGRPPGTGPKDDSGCCSTVAHHRPVAQMALFVFLLSLIRTRRLRAS